MNRFDEEVFLVLSRKTKMLRIEKMLEKINRIQNTKANAPKQRKKQSIEIHVLKQKRKQKKIKLNKTKYLKNYSMRLFIDETDG